MLDAGVGVELVERPAGADAHVDRGVRGHQQSRRRRESHQESSQVSLGQSERR